MKKQFCFVSRQSKVSDIDKFILMNKNSKEFIQGDFDMGESEHAKHILNKHSKENGHGIEYVVVKREDVEFIKCLTK